MVVGEGQAGCRTNAVDCSRCLSGSGRVAVGGGIGGGGGGGRSYRSRSRCVGAREPAGRCSSKPELNQQRMVPRMLNPTLLPTRTNPHLRRVFSGQIRSEKHFGGSLIGMPSKYLLPQTTLMNLSEAFITPFRLASEGRLAFQKKWQGRHRYKIWKAPVLHTEGTGISYGR